MIMNRSELDGFMAALELAVAKSVKEDAEAVGQWTLGMLIEALKRIPGEKLIVYDVGFTPGIADSYRGYYEQLAFSYSTDDTRTIAQVLSEASAAVGETFEGYKGGEFRMGLSTWIWAADYSMCGRQIVGLDEQDDVVVVLTKEYEL